MMTMSDVMGASIFSCFKILAGRKPPNLQTETPMNYGCWRAIWKNCEERLSCKRRTSTATTTTTREEEGTRDKFTNTWTNGWNSGCGRGGKKQDRGLRSVKSKKARLFWFPKKLARSIGSKIETQNGSRRKSESNKNMCVRELLISVQKHRTFAVFLWSLAWGSGSAISLNVSFGKGISSTVYVYLYNSISDSGTSGRRFHLTDLTHCRRSRAIWTTRTREKKCNFGISEHVQNTTTTDGMCDLTKTTTKTITHTHREQTLENILTDSTRLVPLPDGRRRGEHACESVRLKMSAKEEKNNKTHKKYYAHHQSTPVAFVSRERKTRRRVWSKQTGANFTLIKEHYTTCTRSTNQRRPPWLRVCTR